MRHVLSVLALSFLLLGCPPPPPPVADVDLPEPEKTPPPPQPRKPKPVEDDDKPVAAVDTASMAALTSGARAGVIEALPHLKVFLKEKRIEIEGITAMKVGPQLELLACSPRGKAYESLLVWLCKPEDLHLALLMIGMTPTPQVQYFGERTDLKKGEKVVIEVEWTDPEKKTTVRRRVEDLLFDIYRDGCMKYAGFVFTGSHQLDVPQPPDWETTKKQYAASVTGTVACTYHDPDGILDTPLAEGGNNTTFVAWEQRLPERHTLCTTHIRPWRDGDDKEPADALRPKSQPRPAGGGAPGGGGEGPPPPKDNGAKDNGDKGDGDNSADKPGDPGATPPKEPGDPGAEPPKKR